MKTIATFAAVTALIAGVSIASAQGTMNKSGTSAHSSTNAQYCLDINGAKSCKYPTLASCQKDAKGTGTCSKNPNFAAKDNGMKSNAMEPKSGMKKSSPIKQESDSVKKQ